MLPIFPKPVLPPGHLQWFSPPIWGISLSLGQELPSGDADLAPRTGADNEFGRDSKLLNGQSGVRWVPRSEILWWWEVLGGAAASSSPSLLFTQGKGEGIVVGEKSPLCLRVCRIGWTQPQNYVCAFAVRGEKWDLNIALVLDLEVDEEVSNKNS